MGAAEQRQVRTGVADQVRQETDQQRLQHARLAEIRRSRLNLEDHRRHERGFEQHLRTNVGLAILEANPPSDEELAREAGWTVDQVEQLRVDLANPPMSPRA